MALNYPIALQHACKEGCLTDVRFLVENGTIIDDINDPALIIAIENNRVAVIDYLLGIGARLSVEKVYRLFLCDPGEKSNPGSSGALICLYKLGQIPEGFKLPLFLRACYTDNEPVVRFLLDVGIPTEEITKGLPLAVEDGNEILFSMLYERLGPSSKGFESKIAIRDAALGINPKMMKCIYDLALDDIHRKELLDIVRQCPVTIDIRHFLRFVGHTDDNESGTNKQVKESNDD